MEVRSYHIFGHILGVDPGMAIEFVCWSFTMDVSIIDFKCSQVPVYEMGLVIFREKVGRKNGTSHSKTEVFSGELIEQKGDFSIVLFDYERDPEGNYKL